MRKWLLLSVLCVVLAVVWGGYAPVQAQTGTPTIDLLGLTDESDGGCSVTYRMTNNYGFAYRMDCETFLYQGSGGRIIGKSIAAFPPTSPGKSSETKAIFHQKDLAGGKCSNVLFVEFVATLCEQVDTGRPVDDVLCKATRGYHYLKVR
jgi:hypothetical protein